MGMKKPKLLFIGVDGAMPSYIKQEVEKGHLPGFARLIENGVFFEDCMTVYPSISPTCWNAIYTGAVPSVHGGTCEVIRLPGANPWELVTSYHSDNIKAERFWETAAKKGFKSLVISGCGAGPAKTDNVNQIGGGVTITPNKRPGETYVSGIPQQYFHINSSAETVSLVISDTKVNGAFFNGEDISLPKGRELEPGVYAFHPTKTKKFYNPQEVEDFFWVIIPQSDGVKVGADVESAKAAKTIGQGEWTAPLTRELMTDDGIRVPFHFRARLDKMDVETGEYVVYFSACKNLYKEVQHKENALEILDIAEVHTVYSGLDGGFDEDKYFDVKRFDDVWREQVIARNLQLHDYDVVFDYVGYVDTVNHYFRSEYEGYDHRKEVDLPEGAPETARAHAVMERCYKQVDKHIQWMLDNVVGEDTQVCIMSDHGSVGHRDMFNQHVLLEQAGLITYTTDRYWSKVPYREKSVDWSKTKAYTVGCGNVYVNLEGREPCGIVKPEDYHKVVGEIIDALHKYGRDGDGFPVVAFAVPNDQAGFVGQGGPLSGDVVFGMLGGKAGGFNGGVHAQQIPSARNATGGDIRSLCIMCGSKFKKGVTLSRPIDLTDIAPTMCYAGGLPQPKDATGGVIFQALKEE